MPDRNLVANLWETDMSLSGSQENQPNPYLPTLARRDFLRIGGVGVAGYSLLPLLRPQNVEAKEATVPRGGADH